MSNWYFVPISFLTGFMVEYVCGSEYILLTHLTMTNLFLCILVLRDSPCVW